MKFTRSQLVRLQGEYPVGDPLGGPASGLKRDFISEIFGGGDSPPAPDYTPVAQASKEAAQIAADQADRVLAESKRQYDTNMAIAQPVIDAQLGIMQQTKEQGKDYYDYMVANQRPVEQKLNEEAMAAGSQQEQDLAASRATADVRRGTTQQQNQAIRQAMRYGLNPSAIQVDTTATGTAIASAANQAREKEKQTGFAKRLDVAGLYRGLPGASQGAYGVAVNAGNSAVNNSIAPGAQLQAGTVASGNMAIQGGQIGLQGASTILNSQQAAYNTGQQAASANSAGLGNLIGMGLKYFMA